MERDYRGPEQEIHNLSKYGYREKDQLLAKRINSLLEDKSRNLSAENIEFYSCRVTAYSIGHYSTEELKAWAAGNGTPPEETRVRLAISLDFANQLRNFGEDDTTIKQLYLSASPQFNSHCMATALRTVEPEDLASVHNAFEEIICAEMACLPYSAQGIAEGMEKYFLNSREE